MKRPRCLASDVSWICVLITSNGCVTTEASRPAVIPLPKCNAGVHADSGNSRKDKYATYLNITWEPKKSGLKWTKQEPVARYRSFTWSIGWLIDWLIDTASGTISRKTKSFHKSTLTFAQTAFDHLVEGEVDSGKRSIPEQRRYEATVQSWNIQGKTTTKFRQSKLFWLSVPNVLQMMKSNEFIQSFHKKCGKSDIRQWR